MVDQGNPDIVGRHNQDLDLSSSRISQGGTWKRQRIIRIKPSAAMIPVVVAESHECLIYPPNQMVHRALALGDEVGVAYSKVIEQVLGHPELSQWEFILTLEHDNGPPSDGVLLLLESMEAHPEFSCISGLYWTKGAGGVPQIWGDPADPVLNFRPQVPRAGQLVECCGTGMGFALWRLAMFKDARLRKPWFRTLAGREGVGTQDLYFWTDARKFGHRCAVDCRVKVGHYDGQTWW